MKIDLNSVPVQQDDFIPMIEDIYGAVYDNAEMVQHQAMFDKAVERGDGFMVTFDRIARAKKETLRGRSWRMEALARQREQGRMPEGVVVILIKKD